MNSRLDSRNILIVEDYAESAETFKELLEIFGHQVSYVTSGSKALEVMRSERFDLVFMDINLPDISGIDLLHNLRQTVPDAVVNTKFAAVSGYSTQDAQGAKAASVFDFYLEKPVDMGNLDKILATFRGASA